MWRHETPQQWKMLILADTNIHIGCFKKFCQLQGGRDG